MHRSLTLRSCNVYPIAASAHRALTTYSIYCFPAIVSNVVFTLLQLLQALDADSSARNMQLANRFLEIDDVTGDE